VCSGIDSEKNNNNDIDSTPTMKNWEVKSKRLESSWGWDEL
jgi:hypothetical protein